MPEKIERVAVVLKGYPRLSETFIAQEIRELERSGLDIDIYSLRRPTDRKRHPVHDEIRAAVNYLPEYLHDAPLRVLCSWWAVRGRPGYKAAFSAFVKDFRRDPTRNRVRRFGQALVLAAELRDGTDIIYSHFLHTPSSAARYASMILQTPWSFSAHAKDIWTIPDWEKREKMETASWGVTCTRSGCEHLNGLEPSTEKTVSLVYHGIDLSRFPRSSIARSASDGRTPETPVTIVSVGRLVPKKGYADLLEALANVPDELFWRFVHIGGGELASDTKNRAERLGLSGRIEWRGPQSQSEVLEALRQADIFALMSRIDETGDRDGLPNVLMEAQSQDLAVVSTNVSAIPELVLDGQTGLLVPPEDVNAMTDALVTLITNPQERERLGLAGGERVRTAFSHDACFERLALLFGRGDASANQAAAE